MTGATGNAVVAALGIVFSLPLLRRPYRGLRTWKAPAIALTIFALMFSLSAFVIGPVINDGASSPGPAPGNAPARIDHDAHHS